MREHVVDSANKPEPPEKSADKIEYAGFWVRLAAHAVDAAVFLPLAYLQIVSDPYLGGLATVLSFISYIIYQIYCVATYGQTLGKMFVGIQVLDYSHKKADFGQAVLRSAPYLVMLVLSTFFLLIVRTRLPKMEMAALTEVGEMYIYPFYLNGLQRRMMMLSTYMSFAYSSLAIATVFFNKRKRSIDDFIADTVVVQRREKSILRILFSIVLSITGAHLVGGSTDPYGGIRYYKNRNKMAEYDFTQNREAYMNRLLKEGMSEQEVKEQLSQSDNNVELQKQYSPYLKVYSESHQLVREYYFSLTRNDSKQEYMLLIEYDNSGRVFDTKEVEGSMFSYLF